MYIYIYIYIYIQAGLPSPPTSAWRSRSAGAREQAAAAPPSRYMTYSMIYHNVYYELIYYV